MNPSDDVAARLSKLLQLGDDLRRNGDSGGAQACYEEAAGLTELPPSSVCLRLAQLAQQQGDVPAAQRWAVAVVDAGEDYPAWQQAAMLLGQDGGRQLDTPPARRTARVALLGSSTTNHFAPMLRLAARRLGIVLELWEAGYGQYEQEILDPSSQLYGFKPDVVVLAVDESAVRLPNLSSQPQADVEAEESRWTHLWHLLIERCGARVVHHNFVVPLEDPLGHLSAALPGSRSRLLQALNGRLAEAAPPDVVIVDVDRLAARAGKADWVDPRYWHLYKLPASLGVLPHLGRHTAARLAAQLGLSRKCLAFDLDNTVWGGVLGEEGVDGISLGTGPTGSPYQALQSYMLQLKERGILLAVCSKNDDSLAREPFDRHPDMRLKLDDVAVFIANWEPKSTNLRRLAATLDIGLDAIAFLDDNPLERQEIRRLLPDVDVIPLPSDPALYVRALSDYTGFETTGLTAEDAQRTAQYRARAQALEMQRNATSLEEYYRELRMRMLARPIEDVDVPRVAQLAAKTNQFNVTTRRHSVENINSFMRDPDCVHLSFRVRDRFADHGLIGVMIANRLEETLDIDTWLMSCRVIGRGVEEAMLEELERRASELGCSRLRGTYIPTAKNGLVADLFARMGFQQEREASDGATTWTRAIGGHANRDHQLQVTDDREEYNAAA